MNLTFPKVNGTIDIYMDVLRAICGDTVGKSMLDICCCFAPNTPKLGFEKRTYIDIIDRKLDHPEEQKFFYRANILELMIIPPWPQFDVVLCLDGIEHFLQHEGNHVIRFMEKVAHKQIIFTPTTALFGLAEYSNKDPEAHRSLWTPEMFHEKGWHTIVFPDYHPTWSSGAFFAFRSDDDDFERVKQILNSVLWAMPIAH